MLSEKAVFRSAFTPEGWMEPVDGDRPRTVLLHTPPLAAGQAVWERLLGGAETEAHFIDPLSPGWLEGVQLRGQPTLLLKSDGLHPRRAPSAPFYDGVWDLYAGSSPLRPQDCADGLLLQRRQQQVLLAARSALEAARAFLGENLRAAAQRLQVPAVQQQAQQLYALVQKAPVAAIGCPGCSVRFYTAAGWRLLCAPALRRDADTIVLLQDRDGAAARMILYLLLRWAQRDGEPVCQGRCPLFWPDKLDHLRFPARRLVFSTVNGYHSLTAPGSRRLDCAALQRPFTPAEQRRLRQNARRGHKMLQKAGLALREVWRLQAAQATLCPLALPDAVPARLLQK